jgi:hypothetical protein
MPRTVEGIVQAHQISQDRIRAGKPSWESTLGFMKVLGALSKRYSEGDTTLTAQILLEGFQAAAKEIRAKVPQAQQPTFESGDEDLEDFVSTLEEWTVASIESAPEIFEEFDEILDRLYDWCDVNRWWITPA